MITTNSSLFNLIVFTVDSYYLHIGWFNYKKGHYLYM